MSPQSEEVAVVQPKPVKRPRHLMDPDNPVRPVNNRALSNVQRWVMSVLAVFTILHLAVGMVLAALVTNHDATAPRIGLNIIAGVFGVLGIAAGFAIHKKSVLTPWLLVGLIPMIVGLWLAFG